MLSGHASNLWISPNRRYQGQFEAAENSAEDLSLGLWSSCAEFFQDEVRQADSPAPSDQCIIKGNVSEKGFGLTYYLPGCANYNRVKIDPDNSEQWFCSEEAAIAAGFEKSGSCNGK